MKNKITTNCAFSSYELGDYNNDDGAKIKLEEWIKEFENSLSLIVNFTNITHSTYISGVIEDDDEELEEGEDINTYREIEVSSIFNTTDNITDEIVKLLDKKIDSFWNEHEYAIVWRYGYTISINDERI